MRSAIRDLIERVAITYAEAFLSVLVLSAAGGINLSTVQAAALAGIPATVAAFKAGLTHLALVMPRPANRWLDIVERVVFTFLETFLGVLMVRNAYDLTSAKAAAIAGVAAGLAVVKTSLASVVPGTVTPASLAPGATDWLSGGVTAKRTP